MYSFGFLGAGHMAEALMSGMVQTVDPSRITFYNRTEARRHSLAERFGCSASANNAEVFQQSDVVILAIKPQQLKAVASELEEKKALSAKPLIISILAGVTVDSLSKLFNSERICRAMPNLAAQVGAGMTVLSAGSGLLDGDQTRAEAIFNAVGKTLWLSETGLDQASAVNGCGPAFFFMAMEACADALVALGIPRQDAYTLTSQTMLGAAQLQLTNNEHPAVLKDRVTSPAGTTIAGVLALEEAGLRDAFAKAVTASYQRTKALSEGK